MSKSKRRIKIWATRKGGYKSEVQFKGWFLWHDPFWEAHMGDTPEEVEYKAKEAIAKHDASVGFKVRYIYV